MKIDFGIQSQSLLNVFNISSFQNLSLVFSKVLTYPNVCICLSLVSFHPERYRTSKAPGWAGRIPSHLVQDFHIKVIAPFSLDTYHHLVYKGERAQTTIRTPRARGIRALFDPAMWGAFHQSEALFCSQTGSINCLRRDYCDFLFVLFKAAEAKRL